MTHSHQSEMNDSEETSVLNLGATKGSTMAATATNEPPVHSPTHRHTKRKQRKRRTELDPGDDGYRWHKYGQKTLMDTTFIRGYYRCAQKGTGCQAKKLVDNHASGNATLRITYDGQHNHPMPQLSREVVVPSKVSYFSNPSLTRHPSGVSSITTVDHESDEEAAKHKDGNLQRINLNFSPILAHGGMRENMDFNSGDLERSLHSNTGISMDNFSLPSYQPFNPNPNSLASELRDSFGSFEYGTQLKYGSPQVYSSNHTHFPGVYRTSSVDSPFSLANTSENSPEGNELKLDLSLSL